MKWVSLLLLSIAVAGRTVAETPEVASDITRTPNGETIVHLSFVTTASPDKLWRALTVVDELTKWAAPAARVELKPGGRYEYYFHVNRPEGRRGMEGTRVLSYIPGKMLSHTGTLPDSWVIWTIEPAGDEQVLHYYAVGTTTDWNDTASARMGGLTEMVEKLAKYVQP